MAKPICIIKVDNRDEQFANNGDIQQLFDNRLPDYHVIVVPFKQFEYEHYEPIQIQVFFDKDFTAIQYEALKDLIIEQIAEKENA